MLQAFAHWYVTQSPDAALGVALLFGLALAMIGAVVWCLAEWRDETRLERNARKRRKARRARHARRMAAYR